MVPFSFSTSSPRRCCGPASWAPAQLPREDPSLPGAGPGGEACAPWWVLSGWQSPLSRDLPAVSRCFLPGAPKSEASLKTSGLGWELSPSTRDQGARGGPWLDPHWHGKPLPWQRLGKQRRPGQPSPYVGTRGWEHYGPDSSADRAPLSLHR